MCYRHFCLSCQKEQTGRRSAGDGVAMSISLSVPATLGQHTLGQHMLDLFAFQVVVAIFVALIAAVKKRAADMDWAVLAWRFGHDDDQYALSIWQRVCSDLRTVEQVVTDLGWVVEHFPQRLFDLLGAGDAICEELVVTLADA